MLYHELRPAGADYSYVVSTEAFKQHLDLYSRIRSSGDCLWPEITFDDGHLSNHRYALPLLGAASLIARFFITAGWTGQKADYMGWPELRALAAAGHLLGAHGWSHTLLTHCNDKDLDRELKGARLLMEDHLGTSVQSMSLPGGRFNARVLRACRDAGYTEVFTSVPESQAPGNASMVGRLNIRGDMTVASIEDLFQPGSSQLARMARQYRIKSAAKSLLGDRAYARIWSLLNREEATTSTGVSAE